MKLLAPNIVGEHHKTGLVFGVECTVTATRLQNQPSEAYIAAEDAEAGMAKMSKVYDETGRELYMGAGDRQHD